jgi:hypothetical protein
MFLCYFTAEGSGLGLTFVTTIVMAYFQSILHGFDAAISRLARPLVPPKKGQYQKAVAFAHKRSVYRVPLLFPAVFR